MSVDLWKNMAISTRSRNGKINKERKQERNYSLIIKKKNDGLEFIVTSI